MERWKKEAEFVLEAMKKDEEILFSEDDGEHTKRKERDEFVAKWGFSYDDMWDLDKAIAMFIVPRIAYFRTNNIGVPGIFIETAEDGHTPLNEEESIQKWNAILETICDGFHLYLEKDHMGFTEEEKKLWFNAKKYLFDYFEYLWY